MKQQEANAMQCPEPLKSLYNANGDKAMHFRDGKRCICHGHCGLCHEPAVMDKLGRYVHLSSYKAKAARKRR